MSVFAAYFPLKNLKELIGISMIQNSLIFYALNYHLSTCSPTARSGDEGV